LAPKSEREEGFSSSVTQFQHLTHFDYRASSSSSMFGVRRGGDVVRVVVAGDTGTGKTCLVQAAPLFPHCDGVPITIIDTSSR